MIREIVLIDEQKCDGCGLCVPACAEGAIQIINGKARLVSDQLCDGLGACLGHCPQNAIQVIKREAAAFDAEAVAAHTAPTAHAAHPTQPQQGAGCPGNGGAPASTGHQGAGASSFRGCPSSRFLRMGGAPAGRIHTRTGDEPGAVSALAQWPVQLHLLPVDAPALRGAELLVCADCVPYGMADFHRTLLAGRVVAVGCPKLDDLGAYVEKLTEMIGRNALAGITVARMEVPCCGGILQAVVEARRRSGRPVCVSDVVVSTRGSIIARRDVPVTAGREQP
jgi:Pyruvate/2-oxoacid:ferredoxin oxidoreductase delta subunit